MNRPIAGLLVAAAGLSAGLACAQVPGTVAGTSFANGRGTVAVEALLFWFKSSPTPVPIITDDVLGHATTNVLLGGGSIDTNPNPGFRISGSYALERGWGIEALGFYVPSRTSSRQVSSPGTISSTDLLLPFFDVTTAQESATEISFSPLWAGSAQETLTNSLGGGELNATWMLTPQGGWRNELIGGFRYLQLREDYAITTSSPTIPPYIPDIWNTSDQFNARNRFYGLQVGLRAAYDSGPWVGTGVVKLGVGSMQQRVSVSGQLDTNDFTNNGPVQTYPSGYFALPTNSGNHTQNQFAAIADIGLSLGYRLTPVATVYAGYSFLYLSNVVRPGAQINRNINPSYSVAYGGEPPAKPAGPAQPTFGFSTTDFWAQSLTIGFAYRF